MSDPPPDPEFADMFGPLERSGAARGWLVVVVAVIVGALLMPSATRATVAPASTSSGATSPSATGPAVSTTTTAAPGPTTTVRNAARSTTTTRPSAANTNVPPSTIHVLVANGTNTSGAAASVSAYLTGKGFPTLKPVNALTTVSATQVYPIAGDTSSATEVAQALGLSASSVEPNSMPVPVSSDAGANVVVIVGPDILSRASSSGA